MTADTAARAETLSRPIADCVTTLFPTPLAVHVWPDSEALNAELRAIVLGEAAGGASRGRSNVGGWHSANDFVHRPDAPIRRLMQRIRVMVGEMTRTVMKPGDYRFSVEGWANLLGYGQYNSLHTHPGATWSGVYYVTGNPPPAGGTGDPAFSGKIEFVDPRPGASASHMVENAMQQRSMLNPGPGTMIVFPSWLQHQVHPYFGPESRISIAFNVIVEARD